MHPALEIASKRIPADHAAGKTPREWISADKERLECRPAALENFSGWSKKPSGNPHLFSI